MKETRIKAYQPARLSQHLQSNGVAPTRQRMEIAAVLLEKPQHLCAEQILDTLNKAGSTVSKATVYNTLKLFAEKGLVRTINVEGDRTYYDSNTTAHAHFYHVDTGELSDIEPVRLDALPTPPEGLRIEQVDVLIRVSGKPLA